MSRIAFFVYGVACYAVFFATFVYSIGWIGNLFVPRSMDSAPSGPLWQALLIDLGLLTAFALQHSVMARPSFKAWWTRYVPAPVERTTYVLATVAVLVPLFVFWQPLPQVVPPSERRRTKPGTGPPAGCTARPSAPVTKVTTKPP